MKYTTSEVIKLSNEELLAVYNGNERLSDLSDDERVLAIYHVMCELRFRTALDAIMEDDDQ